MFQKKMSSEMCLRTACITLQIYRYILYVYSKCKIVYNYAVTGLVL